MTSPGWASGHQQDPARRLVPTTCAGRRRGRTAHDEGFFDLGVRLGFLSVQEGEHMIAGLESIGDGELLIGDRVVNNMAPKERDIAMVFQNYALYPHMTVRANRSQNRAGEVTPESFHAIIAASVLTKSIE